MLGSEAGLEQFPGARYIRLAFSADKKSEDTVLPTNEIILDDRNRRKRLRFPLETELRYQFSEPGQRDPIRGTGQVENVSSRGVAFRTDVPLEPGLRLSVSMAWPAKLNDCLLRLAFQGVVLRVRGNFVVVTLDKPEFRIAGRATVAAREEIAAVATNIESLVASKGVHQGVGTHSY